MINRRYQRACRRAMRDPRFQEIQALIGQPDGSILLDSPEDCDLWGEQSEIFGRINPAPWFLRLRWWLDRLGSHP